MSTKTFTFHEFVGNYEDDLIGKRFEQAMFIGMYGEEITIRVKASAKAALMMMLQHIINIAEENPLNRAAICNLLDFVKERIQAMPDTEQKEIKP